MAIQIKLKNSVVQDSTPSTSDLPAVGEIALNANINSIGGFMRASDNTIVKIFGPGSLSTPTATTTVSGISELATNAETTTGSATNRVVTPAGLNAVTVAERTTSNTNYVAKAGSTLTGVLTMPNGSNSAPAINFGDSDSGIFGGTNTVSLAAGGTTRLTADTGVSVIGTLAVTGSITSTSDLTIGDKIIHAGDTNTAIRFPAADTVSVETGGSEKFRVDSGGHISIGTSTSRSIGGAVERKLQIEATDATAGISITRNGNANTPAFLSFGKQRSGAVGGNTIVQDNDQLGQIHFAGADGTDIASIAANISAFVDGTPGSNDMPGRLEFKTTADGADSPTTRLTIDSAGLVKIPDNGKFVAGLSSDLQIYHDTNHSYVLDNGTGELRLASAAGGVRITKGTAETLALFNVDGNNELYYDNSKKFETTSTGATLTGVLISDGLTLLDNEKILFGNNNDLEIFHNGTNNIIQSDVGDLQINSGNSAGDVVINTNNNVNNDTRVTSAKFIKNGAVELYHNNIKMLETADVGVRVGDSKRYVVGDDNDGYLRYHSSTVELYVAHAQPFKVSLGGETALQATANGAVELYYDNSKKFETQTNGVTVQGSVFALGTTPQLRLNSDTNDGSTTRALFGMATTANNFVNGSEVNDVILNCPKDFIISHGTTELMAHFKDDSSVELYCDGSKRFQTLSSGVKIIGLNATGSSVLGDFRFKDQDDNLDVHYDAENNKIVFHDNNKATFGTSDDLEIYHNGNNSFIVDQGTGSLIIQGSQTLIRNTSGHNQIVASNDVVELNYDNSKKFETTSGGVKITGVLSSSITSGQAITLADNAQIHLGTGDDLKIYHSGSHGILNNITGSLQVQDAGTEKFRVSGTGTSFKDDIFIANDDDKINIGASNDLQLYHSGNFNFIVNNNSKNLAIQAKDGENAIVTVPDGAVQLYYDSGVRLSTASNGVSVSGRQTVQCGSDAVNSLLQTTNSGGAYIQHATGASGATIAYTGHSMQLCLSPTSGNYAIRFEGAALEFAQSNNIKARITTHGGIAFGSDTAANNTLADYEQGSWTPTAFYGSGSFSAVNNVVCRYVKVGNLVHISGRFSLTGGGSGELKIEGLPFAKGNPSGDGNSAGIQIYVEGAASNITNDIVGLILDATTQIFIRRSGTTSSGGDMAGLVDGGTTLLIGGTYTTFG